MTVEYSNHEKYAKEGPKVHKLNKWCRFVNFMP